MNPLKDTHRYFSTRFRATVYQYRGRTIVPTKNGWWEIWNVERSECIRSEKTLTKAKAYVDIVIAEQS